MKNIDKDITEKTIGKTERNTSKTPKDPAEKISQLAKKTLVERKNRLQNIQPGRKKQNKKKL